MFTNELTIKDLKVVVRIIIVALLFTMLIHNSGIIAVDDDLVVLQDVEGEVYHRSQGFWFFSRSWQQAESGIILQEGDQLKTEAGQCEVVFMSGARVLVEEDSKLELLKNDSESDLQLVELEAGQIVIDIFEPLRDGLRFEIETPSAIAGIRGTRFSVEVDDKLETAVMVRKGEVEVANQVMTEQMRANQKAVIKDGEQKFAVDSFNADDESIWQEIDHNLEQKEKKLEEIKSDVKEKIKDKNEAKGVETEKNNNSEQAEDKKPDSADEASNKGGSNGNEDENGNEKPSDTPETPGPNN